MEEKLAGLRLTSVTLAKAVTGFSVEGRRGEEFVSYDLSTMFEICFEQSSIFEQDIVDHESTLAFWDCLERTVEGITLSGDGRVCEIRLSEGRSIFVWSKDRDHDNLFIAKRRGSDEWFAIG